MNTEGFSVAQSPIGDVRATALALARELEAVAGRGGRADRLGVVLDAVLAIEAAAAVLVQTASGTWVVGDPSGRSAA